MRRPNRTTIEIPEPLRARLRAYAEESGLQQSEIIRAALNTYLDHAHHPAGPGRSKEKAK